MTRGTDGARWAEARRVRACETPTWCLDAPDAIDAHPATIVAMPSIPTILLILSLPVGAVAYVTATRILCDAATWTKGSRASWS